MAGAQSRSGTQTPQPPSAIEGPAGSDPRTNGPLPEGDPFAALMAMMGQQGPGDNDSTAGPLDMSMLQQNLFNPTAPPAPTQRTLLQKIMPIVHLIAGWLLLAYFVIWREPQAYEIKQRAADVSESGWKRWAELGSSSPDSGWGVQFVVSVTEIHMVIVVLTFLQPFFWAFTTLTLLLHTWRIFKGLVRSSLIFSEHSLICVIGSRTTSYARFPRSSAPSTANTFSHPQRHEVLANRKYLPR